MTLNAQDSRDDTEASSSDSRVDGTHGEEEVLLNRGRGDDMDWRHGFHSMDGPKAVGGEDSLPGMAYSE